MATPLSKKLLSAKWEEVTSSQIALGRTIGADGVPWSLG